MKILLISFFCFLFVCLGYQQTFKPQTNLSSQIELNLLAYKAR